MRAWKSTRALTGVVIGICAIAGGVVGSVTHAGAGIRYESAAAIVIPTSGSQRVDRTRWEMLAEIVKLPSTAAEAADIGLRGEPQSLARKVAVSGKPSAGVLAVTARDASPEQATGTANAFAYAAVEALVRIPARGAEPVAIEDFEFSLARWNRERSIFGVTAGQLAIVRGQARYGVNSLAVRCAVAGTCGAWTAIAYPFLAGRRYTATGWVRSPSGRRQVEVRFGASEVDSARSLRPAARGRWTRFITSWTPTASASTAQLAIASDEREPRTIRLDGITVLDLTATARPPDASALSPRAERRVFADTPQPTFFPARPVATIRSSATVHWAMVGAVLGIIVGLVGLGAGWLARTRLDSSTPNARRDG